MDQDDASERDRILDELKKALAFDQEIIELEKKITPTDPAIQQAYGIFFEDTTTRPTKYYEKTARLGYIEITTDNPKHPVNKSLENSNSNTINYKIGIGLSEDVLSIDKPLIKSKFWDNYYFPSKLSLIDDFYLYPRLRGSHRYFNYFNENFHTYKKDYSMLRDILPQHMLTSSISHRYNRDLSKLDNYTGKFLKIDGGHFETKSGVNGVIPEDGEIESENMSLEDIEKTNEFCIKNQCTGYNVEYDGNKWYFTPIDITYKNKKQINGFVNEFVIYKKPSDNTILYFMLGPGKKIKTRNKFSNENESSQIDLTKINKEYENTFPLYRKKYYLNYNLSNNQYGKDDDNDPLNLTLILPPFNSKYDENQRGFYHENWKKIKKSGEKGWTKTSNLNNKMITMQPIDNLLHLELDLIKKYIEIDLDGAFKWWDDTWDVWYMKKIFI